MSVEKFIADRISNSNQSKGNISKPIVKIGVIGIAIGMAVMLLSLSIVLGFKNEIIGKITGLTTHIAISSINVNSSNEPEPIVISEDTLKILRDFKFVKHIQGTAFKNGIVKTETENEGIILKGVGNDYDFSFLEKHLREGRLPLFEEDVASNEVLISEALATKLNLKLNGKMLVYFISQRAVYDDDMRRNVIKYEQRSRNFSICGIFKTDFADFDKTLGIVDIRQIQKLNYWEKNQVANYEITLKDFSKLEANDEEVWELLGYNYQVSNVKELYYNIFMWLDKLDINGVIIIVLMILVATINMITALLILILERTNMVGLLKALGMTNINVRKIFLYISFKLITKGLLWGNIAGIGLCLLQYYFHIVKLDSETYYIDAVAVQINWLYFLLLNVGTFLVCALMLIFPTLIITRLTPIKTLKFD